MQKVLTAKGLKHRMPRDVIEQIEEIVLYDDGYPMIMVHCDLFYHSKTYDRLMAGEEVEITLEFD